MTLPFLTRLRAKLFGERRVTLCRDCRHVYTPDCNELEDSRCSSQRYAWKPYLDFVTGETMYRFKNHGYATNESRPRCDDINKRGNCRAFEEK